MNLLQFESDRTKIKLLVLESRMEINVRISEISVRFSEIVWELVTTIHSLCITAVTSCVCVKFLCSPSPSIHRHVHACGSKTHMYTHTHTTKPANTLRFPDTDFVEKRIQPNVSLILCFTDPTTPPSCSDRSEPHHESLAPTKDVRANKRTGADAGTGAG